MYNLPDSASHTPILPLPQHPGPEPPHPLLIFTTYGIIKSLPTSLEPLITSSISLATSKISYLSLTENPNFCHQTSSLGLFATLF